MKLLEKLAEESCRYMFDLTEEGYDCRIEDAFEAGFRKAREMAVYFLMERYSGNYDDPTEDFAKDLAMLGEGEAA